MGKWSYELYWSCLFLFICIEATHSSAMQWSSDGGEGKSWQTRVNTGFAIVLEMNFRSCTWQACVPSLWAIVSQITLGYYYCLQILGTAWVILGCAQRTVRGTEGWIRVGMFKASTSVLSLWPFYYKRNTFYYVVL